MSVYKLSRMASAGSPHVVGCVKGFSCFTCFGRVSQAFAFSSLLSHTNLRALCKGSAWLCWILSGAIRGLIRSHAALTTCYRVRMPLPRLQAPGGFCCVHVPIQHILRPPRTDNSPRGSTKGTILELGPKRLSLFRS